MNAFRQVRKFSQSKSFFHTHHGFSEPKNIQMLPYKPTIHPVNDIKDKLLVRDMRKLKSKLRNIKRGCIENMSIVSDFDRTLTLSHYEGREVQSTLGMVTDFARRIRQKKRKEALNSMNSAEEATTGPKEGDVAFEKRWIDKTVTKIIQESVTMEVLKELVDQSHIILRPGFDTFFKLCSQYQIPLYIISGGSSNVVASILANYIDFTQYPGLHVYSNEMIFNEKGEFLQFKEPHVHAIGKESIFTRDRQYKKNVIVLGDHPKDPKAVNNMVPQCKLRIGFANYRHCYLYEKSLEGYCNSYEVTVVNNTGLGFTERIVRYILDQESEQNLFNYLDEHVCTMGEAVKEIVNIRKEMKEK